MAEKKPQWGVRIEGSTRVTVRISQELKDLIAVWAQAAAMRNGHFMTAALTIGARHLAEQLGSLPSRYCWICRKPVLIGIEGHMLFDDDGRMLEREIFLCPEHGLTDRMLKLDDVVSVGMVWEHDREEELRRVVGELKQIPGPHDHLPE